MNKPSILTLLSISILFLLLTGCQPGRDESKLSPIIYISPTAQTQLAETILNRTFESIWIVEDYVQAGFAVPTPVDRRFYAMGNGEYIRTLPYDTTHEVLRFVPDVWASPGIPDSVYYRYEQIAGDTANTGVFKYDIASRRHPEPVKLSGTANFSFRKTAVAGDGFRYNYSYELRSTFTEPAGTPPARVGAVYNWSGTGITWENDFVPSRWNLIGESRRESNGWWTVTFTLDHEEFLRASIDSSGNGTYQIGWDAFGHTYNFHSVATRQPRSFTPIQIIALSEQERLARLTLRRTFELTRLSKAIQRGYAVPNPFPDTTNFLFQPDSMYYVKVVSDTAEAVRFVPDIWRTGGRNPDSVFYRWSVFRGDTATNGSYGYRFDLQRNPPDSLSHLTGLAAFAYRFFDSQHRDYSYALTANLDEPGGNSPPPGGTRFMWSGQLVSFNDNGDPLRWEYSGSSLQQTTTRWTIGGFLQGVEFLRADIDTAGAGTFQLGADNFSAVYNL